MHTIHNETMSINLSGVIRIIRTHIKPAIMFFAFIVLSSFVALIVKDNVYEGIVTLIIEKDTPQILEVKDVMALGTEGFVEYKQYYQTQKEVIKSRSVLKNVFTQLGLDKKPEFAKARDPLLEFSKTITIEELADTRLMKIHAQDKDPKTAALIANTLADVYVRQNMERKINTSVQVKQWLSEEINELTAKTHKADLALQEFKEKNNIVALEDKQNIIMEKLRLLNEELTKAKTRKINISAITKQFNESDNIECLPSVDGTQTSSTSTLAQLKTRYIETESRIAELSKKYKPLHPKMAALLSEQTKIKTRIQTELENAVATAHAQETALEQALEEQKKEALNLSRLSIQYDALDREASSGRKMFNLVLNRLKETSVTNKIETSNIYVLDYADAPIRHVKPRRSIIMILAIFVGFIGGCSLALILDRLDPSIKSYGDIANVLSIPLLGGIPIIEDLEEQKDRDLLATRFPKSTVTEAYRAIRTAILFSSSSKDKRKDIVITSALSVEGKTTCALNLAQVMAQNMPKVLLIDADMRKPRIDKALELSNKIGLSSFLAGMADFDKIVQKSQVPNLSVITSGPIPPNPSELLSSDAMKELIETAKNKFDRVIFDSPPLTMVTDTSIIANHVDGLIFVASAGSTPRQVLPRIEQLLAEHKNSVLGVVLNNVSQSNQDAYFSNYYY